MEEIMHVPDVVLNSDYKMPLLGMGTAAYPMPIDDLTSILVDAIETGYRHFDTAALYGSEEAVGRAVAEAIERGIIKSRQQVFITSKLWCTQAHPQFVLPALKNTIGKLGLEYVDLYLIHWPVSMKPGPPVAMLKYKKEDIVPFDMKGVWKAMEECCRLGLAKSIGVSNFSCTKLSQLLQIANIPPAVNQVEINVAWQQQKLLEYCKEKGVHVSAYSPLGSQGASWNSPIINDIATAKQKSIPQVALRWIYEQGASVIVKSFNKERMKQNLEIFDWELSNEDNFKIQDIPQKKVFNGEDFTHPNGPYKSVDEIWDGEI